MKKTYINPNTKIVNIQTVHMIAESLGKYGNTTISNNSDVLSRQRNSGVWDDDDYED